MHDSASLSIVTVVDAELLDPVLRLGDFVGEAATDRATTALLGEAAIVLLVFDAVAVTQVRGSMLLGGLSTVSIGPALPVVVRGTEALRGDGSVAFVDGALDPSPFPPVADTRLIPARSSLSRTHASTPSSSTVKNGCRAFARTTRPDSIVMA